MKTFKLTPEMMFEAESISRRDSMILGLDQNGELWLDWNGKDELPECVDGRWSAFGELRSWLAYTACLYIIRNGNDDDRNYLCQLTGGWVRMKGALEAELVEKGSERNIETLMNRPSYYGKFSLEAEIALINRKNIFLLTQYAAKHQMEKAAVQHLLNEVKF